MEQEDTNVDNATFGIDLVRHTQAHKGIISIVNVFREKSANVFFFLFKDLKYAFIFDSTILEYIASNRPCTTRIASELFSQVGYGIAFPKNSPYVELFSLQLLKLRENGTVEALTKRWISSGSCLSDENGRQEKKSTLSRVLNLFHLQSQAQRVIKSHYPRCLGCLCSLVEVSWWRLYCLLPSSCLNLTGRDVERFVPLVI